VVAEPYTVSEHLPPEAPEEPQVRRPDFLWLFSGREYDPCRPQRHIVITITTSQSLAHPDALMVADKDLTAFSPE
jgi:hypothetical protein